MERVLHEEPERLKKRLAPRDLETIIAKATARDPERGTPRRRWWKTCGGSSRIGRSAAADLGGGAAGRGGAAGNRTGDVDRRSSRGTDGRSPCYLLYADRQARHAAEVAAANTRITRLASDLEKEGGVFKDERSHSRPALSELNCRLATPN